MKYATKGKALTISQYLERNDLELECIDWLKTNYPNETFALGRDGMGCRENARTHIDYIEHCRRKKAIGLGYWDDSPRFFEGSFGTLMSKTMAHGIHPDEDRFLNVREMLHLMGLPHDFEIDDPKNINHIAQVCY